MQDAGTIKGHAHRAASQKRQKPQGRNGVIRHYIPAPGTWKVARLIAGDVKRLFTMEDGAVLIANSEKRPRWLG